MARESSLDVFCRALKKGKSFLLASHVNPEGDAVGSLLAMDALLRRMGKRTVIVCEDPLPARLGILSSKNWHRAQDIKKNLEIDSVVVADCPTLERIGRVLEFLSDDVDIFNIDHHLTNEKFGDFNYIQPRAAACGEVVYEIFKHLRIPIREDEAIALYVAISTDTGSFRFSNTTVKAHRIVAELIQNGLDVEKINEKLYATHSLRKMKLYGRLFTKVRTAYENGVVWVGMTKEDLHESGASFEDAEGFVDFLKNIQEVKFAFFASETEKDNLVRVSIRSKGECDASRVAVRFGGGGHAKASGCMIQGSLEDAARVVLEEVGEQLNGRAKSDGR